MRSPKATASPVAFGLLIPGGDSDQPISRRRDPARLAMRTPAAKSRSHQLMAPPPLLGVGAVTVSEAEALAALFPAGAVVNAFAATVLV